MAIGMNSSVASNVFFAENSSMMFISFDAAKIFRIVGQFLTESQPIFAATTQITVEMKKNFENVVLSDYEKNYSDEGFWKKVKSVAKKAGAEVIFTALKLYYVARSENTPLWAKTIIYGALGYLILPIDLIADVIPVVGYVDDLAVMAMALGTVECFLTDEVIIQAREKLSEWFDDEDCPPVEREYENEDEDDGGYLE